MLASSISHSNAAQSASLLLAMHKAPGSIPMTTILVGTTGLLLLLLSSEKKKWQLSSEAVTSARSARGNGDMKELRHRRST